MSNQIQITSGAKVRNLEGVLTGSSGIMSSLPINTSLGIPQLDVNGKILVDQLPNSIMEYKGTWNAATNTPTLVNGTGNQGDVYLCEVAGTVNFGAGPISFFVGDQVVYSGSIWQRASGATGTVTSVAVTESGDALTITGSPITTSGTINIGFAGTSGQYVNGAGGLTTFPSLTSYVPYTGATADVNLGLFDLYTAKVWLYDNPNSAYGSMELTDGVLHFEDADGHSMVTMEDGYLTIANASTIRALLNVSGLSANRDYAFPNASGTIALTSNLSAYVPYTGANANLQMGSFDISLRNLAVNDVQPNGDNLYDIGILGGFYFRNIYAYSFVKKGGTSIQFLKADGSIDSNAYLPLTGGSLTGTTSMDGSGGTTSPITLIFNSGINRLLTPVVRLYGGTSIGSNYVELFGTNATSNRAIQFPDASGTVALLSNISYPVTSVFGRTGTVVATSGDYNTSQVTENTNLYFTDARSRASVSLTTTGTSGAATYNSTTGVFNIPQYAAGLSGSGVSGQVTYFDGTSSVAGSNNHFWDASNNRLGINTNAPLSPLHVVIGAGSGTIVRIGEASGTTGKQLLIGIDTTSGRSEIQSLWQGTGFTALSLQQNGGNLLVGTTSDNGSKLQVSGSSTFSSTLSVTGISTFDNKIQINAPTGTSAPGAIALSIRDISNQAFGFDFNLEGVSSGDLYLMRTNSNVQSTVLQISRGSGNATFSGSVLSTASSAVSFAFAFSGASYAQLFQSTSTGYSLGYGASATTIGTPVLTWTSGGNVGIGTITPSATAQISGLSGLPSTSGSSQRGALRIANTSNIGLDFGTVGAGQAWLQVSDVNNYASNFSLLLNPNGGNVGIGCNPGAKFEVNGFGSQLIIGFSGSALNYYDATSHFFRGANGGAGGTVNMASLGTGTVTATSGTLSTVSDMNLKNEDGFIDNALAKVLKLKPRYFHWKEESGLPTDLRQLGFYAQEVNEALGEEAANTPKTENDKWGIYDRGMIAFLTAAIQELKAEIDELKNK